MDAPAKVQAKSIQKRERSLLLIIDKALVSSKQAAMNGEDILKTSKRVFIIPKKTTTPRMRVKVLEAL